MDRMDRQVFELSGGALCLDFANTCSRRGAPTQKERLVAYDDLVAFARQAGVAAEPDAARLAARAHADPSAAASALAAAVDLREALYRLFAAAAAGSPLPEEDLERVNRRLPDAWSSLRLEGTEACCILATGPVADTLDAPLRPILRDAVVLLTTPDLLSRIRECDAPTCTWLFLDHSRNRSRRWCSMDVCGNRAKARRHYRRRRGGVRRDVGAAEEP